MRRYQAASWYFQTANGWRMTSKLATAFTSDCNRQRKFSLRRVCYAQFIIIRPPGTTVPDGLMFYRRCFLFLFFRHAFSEIPQPIALKLCHVVGIWLNFINWLQKFGEYSPKKFWGPKTCEISVNFGPLQTLIANISGTGNVSKIGKTYELGKFVLCLTKKVRWTLVH